MKQNKLFQDCLKNVDPNIRDQVRKNMDAAIKRHKVPVDRDTLLHLYNWMKSAYREIDDDDDFGIPDRIPIFAREEIKEVKNALSRKRI